MPEPRRIQRRRTKGWRMPENTVYVGRGTKWGNPFRVGDTLDLNTREPLLSKRPARVREHTGGMLTAELARDLYRMFLVYRSSSSTPAVLNMPWAHQARNELTGRNLACWCPLDEPCHADVLLELANAQGGDA